MSTRTWTARGLRTVRVGAPYLMFLVSLAALVVFVRREFYAFLGPVVGATAGSALAIGLRRERVEYVTNPVDVRLAVTCTALYVVAVVALYRGVLYVRPPVHYLLFGLVASFIAYQVWVGQPRRHVLPQILVVAFFTYWSVQFTYPAGVITPDTAFVRIAGRVAELGTVPNNVAYTNTPGHMIYAGIGILFTDLSARIAYQTLSVAALLAAVAGVGLLDEAVPGVDRRTAMFGALVFALLDFTLRRGMFPDKTNFFKPLIAVLVLAAFYRFSDHERGREYALAGFVCVPALVFGHMYSSVAAVVVLASLWGYRWLTVSLGGLDYRPAVTRTMATRVVAVVFLGVAGYSVAGGFGFINRSVELLVSFVAPVAPGGGGGGGGSGGGQYSELSVPVLLFSTAGQAMFFTLGVGGIGVAIRRRDWSLDAVMAWVVVAAGLLVASVFVNSVDIPQPRIYLLLGMFGLNLTGAIGLFTLADRFPTGYRHVVVVGVVFVFLAFSLASPIGSVALSPVGDEIPDKWRYHTVPERTGTAWADEHVEGPLLTIREKDTDLPIQQTGATTATVILGNVSDGTFYESSRLARTRGVRGGGTSARLGGTEFLFLRFPPENSRDTEVYDNGHRSVYRHENATAAG